METKKSENTGNAWIVRVSSSIGLGGGHVNRCLTLAKPLSSHASVIFVLDKDGRNWINYIKKTGFEAVCETGCNLPKVRACIIDLRDGAKTFATKWRHQLDFIASFGDVSEAPQDCDVEIGAQFSTTPSSPRTPYLAGPDYALVDPKYYHIGLGKIREKVEQLMISFGLHDTANATSKALLAIKKLEERKLFRPKSILVYLGSQAPHKEDVRYHLQLFGGRAKLVLDSGNILAGLKDCDLAIGGGGVGMFERASAGVPSLTFTIADNQIPNASGAHSAKITMYAGDIRCLSLTQLESAILQMVKNTHLRRVIALSGPQLIDGKGAFRLAGALHRLARGSNMSRPGMT